MKYLKPINEKFDFGYEREIIEDFIEEMSEFDIDVRMVIRENAKDGCAPCVNFEDFIRYRRSDGKFSINISGGKDPRIDPSNIKALSIEEYNYIKGLIEDFKDKIEDLSSLKIIEIGLGTDLNYYYHHKDKDGTEEFKNIRFIITLQSK